MALLDRICSARGYADRNKGHQPKWMIDRSVQDEDEEGFVGSDEGRGDIDDEEEYEENSGKKRCPLGLLALFDVQSILSNRGFL
jgi:hypothetical protein